MPFTLSLQDWGVDGRLVTRAAPTERYGYLPLLGTPLVGLMVENASGGATGIGVVASRACSRGVSHVLTDPIPDATVVGPILLNQGTDAGRFGPVATVDFGPSWAGLLVAGVRIATLYGVGSLGVTAAPAAGGSPGTIPLYTKSETVVMEVCVADGMELDLVNPEVQLIVANGGSTDVPIYLHSERACSQGFLEPEIVTVPAAMDHTTKTIVGSRFGGRLVVTYDSAAGLSIAAVVQESFVA